MSHDDFDFEPIRGLPAVPPDGEQILWQGSPKWKPLAVHAFHVRKVAIYFAILVAWYAAASLYDGRPLLETASATSTYAAISIACVGLLAMLAYGYARSTVYTLTSKRLVLRHGLALPMSINIPFSQLGEASLAEHGETGTLSLTPVKGVRIAWLALWPNVRPWHFANPQPAMRCIAEPQKVAGLLAGAIKKSEGDGVQTAAFAKPAAAVAAASKKKTATGKPELAGWTA